MDELSRRLAEADAKHEEATGTIKLLADRLQKLEEAAASQRVNGDHKEQVSAAPEPAKPKPEDANVAELQARVATLEAENVRLNEELKQSKLAQVSTSFSGSSVRRPAPSTAAQQSSAPSLSASIRSIQAVPSPSYNRAPPGSHPSGQRPGPQRQSSGNFHFGPMPPVPWLQTQAPPVSRGMQGSPLLSRPVPQGAMPQTALPPPRSSNALVYRPTSPSMHTPRSPSAH